MLLHQRTNPADQKQKPQSIDMCAMTSQCETSGRLMILDETKRNETIFAPGKK